MASIYNFPSMPRPQEIWGYQQGNQLIVEQLAYNRQEQQDYVDRGLPTLNSEQRRLYDVVMDNAPNSHGSAFFLYSGRGCGKTYLTKLIAAGVHVTDRIVLCVASTGLVSLLPPGGHIAHSHFKIPISCHEQSTCNIKKDNPIYHLFDHLG